MKNPRSLTETMVILTALGKEQTRETINKTIQGINDGKPNIENSQLLLKEFCLRAKDVREHMGDISNTPMIIEFFAERLALYFSGMEPDLMRALGLKLPGRGRRPTNKAKQKKILIAAKVMVEMDNGKKLNEAAEIIAAQESIHESTAQNYYAENKDEAAILIIHKGLFDKTNQRTIKTAVKAVSNKKDTGTL